MLVVVNSDSSGPRRLAQWLESLGIELVVQLGANGLPETINDFDGLVLLGGGLMPNEYGRAPWLRQERELVAQAIESDLPTLGICLGAQVIADVAGGEVRADYGPKERGSTAIYATEAGRHDTVISAIGPHAPMIENHQDMITRLPDSATLLAVSATVENQAFLIGEHVRGIQFHPEVSHENLKNWDDAAMLKDGFELAAIVSQAEADDEANTQASRALIEAFGKEVLEHALKRIAP